MRLLAFYLKKKIQFLILRIAYFKCFAEFYPVLYLEAINLFVTSKKRNHQFTNLKCYKMSFKAFKIKKARLKMFFKVIDKKLYTIKKGFKRLFGLFAALWIREFVDSFFDVTNRLNVAYTFRFFKIFNINRLIQGRMKVCKSGGASIIWWA